MVVLSASLVTMALSSPLKSLQNNVTLSTGQRVWVTKKPTANQKLSTLRQTLTPRGTLRQTLTPRGMLRQTLTPRGKINNKLKTK